MNRRRRHAQIHLPPLSGETAYIVVAALEGIVAAIWREHGDDMADFQGMAFPDSFPADYTIVRCASETAPRINATSEDDDDLF